jgi:hypothetical protein
MADDVFDEAIIDVVGPNTLLSEPCVVKVSIPDPLSAETHRQSGHLRR